MSSLKESLENQIEERYRKIRMLKLEIEDLEKELFEELERLK